jgi:hypothetical protein
MRATVGRRLTGPDLIGRAAASQSLPAGSASMHGGSHAVRKWPRALSDKFNQAPMPCGRHFRVLRGQGQRRPGLDLLTPEVVRRIAAQENQDPVVSDHYSVPRRDIRRGRAARNARNLAAQLIDDGLCQLSLPPRLRLPQYFPPQPRLQRTAGRVQMDSSAAGPVCLDSIAPSGFIATRRGIASKQPGKRQYLYS